MPGEAAPLLAKEVLTGVRQASVSSTGICAVLADGTVWYMGRNDFGLLGDGLDVRDLSPAAVVGL